MNHDVPQRKTKRERKNGMYSTLFVFITSLIADKGEAYMQMENIVAANPQKSFLILPCSANKDTRAIIAKVTTTTMKRLKILVLIFFGA